MEDFFRGRKIAVFGIRKRIRVDTRHCIRNKFNVEPNIVKTCCGNVDPLLLDVLKLLPSDKCEHAFVGQFVVCLLF